MKSLWLVALVACAHASAVHHDDPPPPPAPPDDDLVIARGPLPPPPPPGPGAVVTKAQPIECPKSQPSPLAPAACKPVIVASGSSLIARIWRLGCEAQVSMRDDGAITYIYNGGRYTVSDRHLDLPGRPLSRGEVQATTIGTHYRVLVDGQDYVLEHAGVCEHFPEPLHYDGTGTTIATSTDGTLTAWAIDANGGYRELERASDDTWRVYPPLRTAPSPAMEMFVQSGRVVSAYRSMIGANIEELGYLDANRRLQPIRRIEQGQLDGLVPGETAEAPPPAAIEIQSAQPAVDVLDREHGYRRTAITDPERSCPTQPEQSSTGFAHRSQVRLFRTAGTLWVAYAVWSGDCRYEMFSGTPQMSPKMSPFLFAHPPPAIPMPQAVDVIKNATLILMAVDGPRRGTTLRESLPHVPFAGPSRDNPVVDDARVRLLLGGEIIDLDAVKLAAR